MDRDPAPVSVAHHGEQRGPVPEQTGAPPCGGRWEIVRRRELDPEICRRVGEDIAEAAAG